jgi:hypothetical protein
VTLDVAWLPTSLTSLKLTGISLSCHGNKGYSDTNGAAYAAMLLQVGWPPVSVQCQPSLCYGFRSVVAYSQFNQPWFCLSFVALPFFFISVSVQPLSRLFEYI